MITVKLKGGLGNQMFQIAAATALATQKKTRLQADLIELDQSPFNLELTIFPNIQLKRASKLLTFIKYPYIFIPGVRKIVKKISTLLPPQLRFYFYEYRFSHIPEITKCPKHCYLDGYWQSEKYFSIFKPDLIKLFEFPMIQNGQNQAYFHQIQSTQSVSLHIRRGDYQDPDVEAVHGNTDLDYYQRALSYFQEKLPNFHLLIFSNDINWVKQHLNLDAISHTFVEGNKTTPYKDMHLMSLCKNNIIANSSFSWWAAWLNPNQDKIIVAPKRWFAKESIDAKDICPDTWVRL